MNMREFVENPKTVQGFVILIVALTVITSLKKMGRVMATVVIILGIIITVFVMNPQWAGSFWTTFDASNPWEDRSPNKPKPVLTSSQQKNQQNKPGAPANPQNRPAAPPKR